MKNKTYQDGIDFVWKILTKYQKDIFKEISECEKFECYDNLIKLKEKAILLGNILQEVDYNKFIKQFELNDSENRYDDIDDPTFNDGGDETTEIDNDEDVDF